jgi:hypothetical protein
MTDLSLDLLLPLGPAGTLFWLLSIVLLLVVDLRSRRQPPPY